VSRIAAHSSIGTQHSRQQTVFGADKVQHFAMTYAVTAFTYAAARSADVGRSDAIGVAAVAAAAAGVGKEVLDRRRGGAFSVSDLIADALGGVAAYSLMKQVR
jgi:uncharacterized protein YfiM (DUF2279 family)